MRATLQTSPRAWTVALLCAAVTGLGAGPGFLFGLVGPELQEDLDISRSSLGLLIGSFFGGTGVASVVAARWAALFGPRGCLVLTMGTLTSSMICIIMWPSFPMLEAAAIASGVAYAFGNVGTTMAVVLATRTEALGLALTVKTAGVPCVAALLALGTAAPLAGWQWLAWCLAVGGLIVGSLVLLILEPTQVVLPSAKRRPAPLPTGFWLLPVAAFLFIAGSQPLQSWPVVYLHDAGNLSSGQAGPAVAAGTLLGTVAMLMVAKWGDRLGATRRALLVAGVSAVAALGVGVTVVGTPWWVPLGLAGIMVGIAANLAGAGLIHAVAADRSAESIGRGSGIMLSGYYIGALVAPWSFGVMADQTGDYQLSWGICGVLLLLASVVSLRIQTAVPVNSHLSAPVITPDAGVVTHSRTGEEAGVPPD